MFTNIVDEHGRLNIRENADADQLISEAAETVAAAAQQLAEGWGAEAAGRGGRISSRSAHVLAISRIIYAAEVKLGVIEEL